MANNFLYVQGHNYSLSGSGISAAATSVTLVNFTDINGNTLAMTDFGTIGYLVLEPKTSKAEIVSFTGVTNNGDGTCTITGLTRGLSAKSPYTAGGFGQSHSGGSIAIISNPPQFYTHFLDLDDTGTVNQLITFGVNPQSTAGSPTLFNEYAIKDYVDRVAIAGAPDASTTTKGIGKVSVAPALSTNPIFVGDNDPRVPTQPENDAMATAGSPPSSANTYMTQSRFQNHAESYGTTVGTGSQYSLAVSPIPFAYVAGMEIEFQVHTASLGTPVLNLNGLGSKTLYKLTTSGSSVLAANDFLGGQIVKVKFDNLLNPQVISPIPVAVSPYATGFGAWAAATVDGAGHQVTTDGFLVISASGSTLSRIVIKSDSASTPTVVRADSDNISAGSRMSVMIPVKKNEYYSVTLTGSPTTTGYFFIPIS